MDKIEYKISKDKDFIGKRYESYTVEKIINKNNGEVERRYRTLFPHFDGAINKIDLDKVYFPKPITQAEWKLLSSEYQKAWCEVEMTKELYKEIQNLREKEGLV